MADFVKYNGYNVKDPYALAHASISGNVLTTTDRKGRTVDTLTLPGGSSHISATSMAYHSPYIDAAYQLCIGAMRNGSSPQYAEPYTLGQVMSDEMIGYGEITYASGVWTLGSIYAQTIRSWDTYDRTDGMGGPGHDTDSNIGDLDSFEDNNHLIHRRAKYKTYLCVGKDGTSTSVPANSVKQLLVTSGGGSSITGTIPVKTPNGSIQGYATIVGAKAVVTGSRNTGSGYTIENAGLILYCDKVSGVSAYNTTANAITVEAFILELDVMLTSDYCDSRFWISVDPYIKYINIEKPTGDMTSSIKVKTNIIIHNRAETTDKKLFEYKLIANARGFTWTSSNVAIPDTDASTYYNTKIIREHTLYTDSYSYSSFCAAVVYAVGAASGSSIVGNAEFTDAMPLPYPLFIST